MNFERKIEFKTNELSRDQRLILQAILFVEENPNVTLEQLIHNVRTAYEDTVTELMHNEDDITIDSLFETAAWYADLGLTLQKITITNERITKKFSRKRS